MPSIITDEMVKQSCLMSRPVPLKAYGMLNPNAKVGTKPSYMKKRGRTGIRYNELPIYAPATVRGLAESMCNISKVNCAEVENYLEERIENEIQLFEGKRVGEGEVDMVMVDPEGVVFDKYDIPDVPPDIVDLEDAETQTTASAMAGTKPLRKGKLEEGKVMDADPSRFESAGATEGETGVGTGELDVNEPRAVQGGFVGRPPSRLRGSKEGEL